jgi:preprotein translocase subunit SecE
VSDSAGTASAARGESGPGGSVRVGRRKDGGPGRIRSIGVFYKQVVAELRKVIWPTRQELITYTSVVLVFVVFMVLLVSVFDFAFSQAVLKVFGN